MSTSKAIAERILELCKECGITINKLSTEAAVRQSTVNDIVNGTTQNAGIVTIKKLCDGLGITLTDFFNTSVFKILSRKSSSQSKRGKHSAPAKARRGYLAAESIQLKITTGAVLAHGGNLLLHGQMCGKPLVILQGLLALVKADKTNIVALETAVQR